MGSSTELGPPVCGLSCYGRRRVKVVQDRDGGSGESDMCVRRECSVLNVFEARCSSRLPLPLPPDA